MEGCNFFFFFFWFIVSWKGKRERFGFFLFCTLTFIEFIYLKESYIFLILFFSIFNFFSFFLICLTFLKIKVVKHREKNGREDSLAFINYWYKFILFALLFFALCDLSYISVKMIKKFIYFLGNKRLKFVTIWEKKKNF